MPNWCSNKVTFTHNDPAKIQRAADAYNRGELFKEFAPCPQELIDTPAMSGVETAQTDSNLEKHGRPDWYSWCLANWGTKWDINTNGDTAEVEDGQLVVELWFDTAWSPPIGFYNKMEALGFKVDAFYYEPGMGFCGRYTMSEDDYYEIAGDADWVDSNIPIEINDAFSISESMSDWESEEENEEE
jgi:hypothetical protein